MKNQAEFAGKMIASKLLDPASSKHWSTAESRAGTYDVTTIHLHPRSNRAQRCVVRMVHGPTVGNTGGDPWMVESVQTDWLLGGTLEPVGMGGLRLRTETAVPVRQKKYEARDLSALLSSIESDFRPVPEELCLEECHA